MNFGTPEERFASQLFSINDDALALKPKRGISPIFPSLK